MARRGWAQVHYNEASCLWDVYDWSEHYDSGGLVSSHDQKSEAERAAQKWAAENSRKYIAAVSK